MDALQFAYWLQGFAELHGQPPTKAQWKVINDHLQLVFQKVTPVRFTTLGPDLTKGATAIADVARAFPLGAVKC
jgi:hypothetical protein